MLFYLLENQFFADNKHHIKGDNLYAYSKFVHTLFQKQTGICTNRKCFQKTVINSEKKMRSVYNTDLIIYLFLHSEEILGVFQGVILSLSEQYLFIGGT